MVGATHVSAGENHSAALSAGGEVYVWGRGEHGQIGRARSAENARRRARSRASLGAGRREHHVRANRVRGDHALALTTRGVVLAWGRGSRPATTRAQTEDARTPTASTRRSSRRTRRARPRARAQRRRGRERTVYTWGDGSRGQLAHRDESGTVYTWGDGSRGQLDGTREDGTREDGTRSQTVSGVAPVAGLLADATYASPSPRGSHRRRSRTGARSSVGGERRDAEWVRRARFGADGRIVDGVSRRDRRHFRRRFRRSSNSPNASPRHASVPWTRDERGRRADRADSRRTRASRTRVSTRLLRLGECASLLRAVPRDGGGFLLRGFPRRRVRDAAATDDDHNHDLDGPRVDVDSVNAVYDAIVTLGRVHGGGEPRRRGGERGVSRLRRRRVDPRGTRARRRRNPRTRVHPRSRRARDDDALARPERRPRVRGRAVPRLLAAHAALPPDGVRDALVPPSPRRSTRDPTTTTTTSLGVVDRSSVVSSVPCWRTSSVTSGRWNARVSHEGVEPEGRTRRRFWGSGTRRTRRARWRRFTRRTRSRSRREANSSSRRAPSTARRSAIV